MSGTNDVTASAEEDPSELTTGVMCWVRCSEWKELPVGSWLVKTKTERKPYHVATVTVNNQDSKIIIVGGHFSWDMDEIIAYTAFEEFYEE